MNKFKIIEMLAFQEGLTINQATETFNLIFDRIIQELKNDGRSAIRGFGSFSVRQYGAYEGRNPKTGATISVKSKRLPVFKMGKNLYEYINHITPKKIKRLVRFCNSYERLPTLIGAFENEKINGYEFLLGLRDYWSVCDNISQYKEDLGFILSEEIWYGEHQTCFLMMDKEEQEFFKELPDTVAIYRGCDEQNQNGISWSLSRDIAIEFPFMHRYKARNPVLVSATVSKDEIVAVKLDREELEVIIFDAVPSLVTPISESDRNPKIEEDKHREKMEMLNGYSK